MLDSHNLSQKKVCIDPSAGFNAPFHFSCPLTRPGRPFPRSLCVESPTTYITGDFHSYWMGPHRPHFASHDMDLNRTSDREKIHTANSASYA